MKEHIVKRIYFPISHVAAKTHVSTHYVREISDRLGIPRMAGIQRTKGAHRRYTKEEMNRVAKIIRTAKKYTKTELAIMICK